MTLVIVKDHWSPSEPASPVRCLQALSDLATDAAATVLGQCRSYVQDGRTLGAPAGDDAVQFFHVDVVLEQVVEDHEALNQVASEPVDVLRGQYVARPDVASTAINPRQSSTLSLPLAFSSKTLMNIGSSASCCRALSRSD